ncbi:MAG: EAL domain-containing protein [Alphaproteobacteria bacterium]|jgi:PAS domain S-box-containing protein|nr:EAL domain-containing protein [Alphaproteobacteria bacterium]MDP6565709.1 EAL domain-containing protein [Alphaproteobacteria bacterium]MDP6814981.1 EAL domain-containing protein [Alphaproteobacteria bacterium]
MATEKSSSADIRRDRDRFVAFAFSAADAFVELDDQQSIRYATGAMKSLSGRTGKDLVGKSFLDLVAPEDRSLLKAAHEMALRQGRCGPLRIRLRQGDGKDVRLELRGTYLPVNGGGLFLSLNHDNGTQGTGPELMDKDSFADAAHEAAKAARDSGRPAMMTMLELDGLDQLRGRLDDVSAADLMSDIDAHLQARAIGGQTVGRFDNDKYGLVHDPDVDLGFLEDSLDARAKSADPEGEGIQVNSASIDLSAGELSDVDDAKALLYTINKFSEQRQDFTIGDLQQSYKMMLEETRGQILVFKNTVTQGEFDVFFQPIVDLRTRNVHHYEALVRLRDGGPEESPFKFITFAENAGVIADFDLAMCGRVMRYIENAHKDGRQLPAAVNLSGCSLENQVFLDRLLQLLGHFKSPRDWLLFEVTESSKIANLEAANKFLSALRDLGHEVCLDDFGSGATAYQYLHALEVDCVKIDGIYVQEARKSQKGKAFIRSISTLCKDLDVATVGEMVEDETSAKFLAEVGIHYGQGWLFGRPVKDVVGWQTTERLVASR